MVGTMNSVMDRSWCHLGRFGCVKTIFLHGVLCAILHRSANHGYRGHFLAAETSIRLSVPNSRSVSEMRKDKLRKSFLRDKL